MFEIVPRCAPKRPPLRKLKENGGVYQKSEKRTLLKTLHAASRSFHQVN